MLFLVVILLVISHSASDPIQAKRFTLNLDLPPEQRWAEIADHYKQFAPMLEKDLRSLIPKTVFPLVEKLVMYVDQHFPAPYPDELRGFAKSFNASLADVILYNLVYDLTAFCTSIVAQDKNDNIYHARNLDYNFAVDLRKVTFMIDFQSKGKTVYSGTTFVGMLGLATAQRPKAVTVTMNERDRGFVIENFIIAILNKKVLPISFLIRNVVGTPNMDFDQAITALSKAPLAADVYFIVGGVKAGEGAVVTRDRTGVANVWKLDAPKRWFLVETNYDHWTTPPPHDDRRDPAMKALNATGQAKISLTTLFNILSIKPVLNSRTIYTTVMQAKEEDAFNTWVQQP